MFGSRILVEMYCPDCRKNIKLVENSTCYTNVYGTWHIPCCKIIRRNKEYPEIDINGPGKMKFVKKANPSNENQK